MKRIRLFTAVLLCLFTAFLTGNIGCAKEEATTEGAATGTSASSSAGSTLSPEAKSAMQAQQKAEAESRAAHAPPGPK